MPRDTSLAARMLLVPIIAYRRWISPGLPPRCRFYPSCSEYAVAAITTHGAVRGLGLALWRLLRCHPFHPGGIDDVPPPRAPRGGAENCLTFRSQASRPCLTFRSQASQNPPAARRTRAARKEEAARNSRDDVTGAVTR